MLPLLQFDYEPEDKKRCFAGLAVLALALIFAFFGRAAPDPGAPPQALVFTQWWEDEMEAGSLQALIGEFRERHPEIDIRLDTRPYGEIRDWLLRAGDPGNETPPPFPRPDILGLDPRWIGELSKNRRLEPLDSGLTDSGGEGTGFYASRGTVALPLVSFMTLLFYNIESLEAAGFDRPPKNRTEFISAARAATDPRKGRYGFTLALSPENPEGITTDIYSWLRAANGPLLDRGKPRFNTPEVTEVLGFLRELYRGKYISPDSFSKTGVEKREEFMSGRAAMMISSVSDIHRVRERNIPFGVTTVPGAASSFGKPAFGLYGWYAGISESSANKAGARLFLSFLAENRSRIGAAAWAVPGSRNAGQGYINDDPLFSKVYSIYEAGEVLEEFTGHTGVTGEENLVREALYRMFEEGRGPGETAAAIQRGWEALRNP
ncbi:MAG: extracellular solute-binding protein [Spirochaetaceae bacterium]|nr:extracellular solute-binding protein [Spirochaetaceae bacterium]